MRLPHRDELLHLVKPKGVYAEIGVLAGAFSNEIFKLNPSMLYLIDTWADDYELSLYFDIEDGQGHLGKITGPEAYSRVQQKFCNERNVKLVRQHSTDALRALPDNHLDMVYIDAEHTYKAVLEELSESFGRVKSGGWIMGHDYTPIMPGVVEAVHEFCRQYQLKLDVLTDEPELPVVGVPEVARAAFNSYGIRVRK